MQGGKERRNARWPDTLSCYLLLGVVVHIEIAPRVGYTSVHNPDAILIVLLYIYQQVDAVETVRARLVK